MLHTNVRDFLISFVSTSNIILLVFDFQEKQKGLNKTHLHWTILKWNSLKLQVYEKITTIIINIKYNSSIKLYKTKCSRQ